MKPWKINLFNKFCVTCVFHNCLTMNCEGLISLCEECAAVAVHQGDMDTQRIVNALLGALHEESHQPSKAIQFYKKQIENGLESSNRKLTAAACESLSNIYRSLGKYEEAIQYHENCLKYAQEMKSKDREAEFLSSLGNDYHYSGNYPKAVEYHEKCLEIAKEIENAQLEATAYVNLGDAYHMLGKSTKAIRYFNKYLQYVVANGDRRGEAGVCGSISRVYDSIGESQKAVQYTTRCLDIAVEIGDKIMEGKAYGNLASAYESLAQYDKALECQEKRLRIAKETGDTVGERAAYGGLGNIYQSLGNIEQALKYHNKYLDYALTACDKSSEGTAYCYLGIDYQALADYQKAKEYQEKSLAIALHTGERNDEGKAYAGLGAVCSALGKIQDAIEHYKKSLNISIELEDKKGEGITYGSLGTAYYSLGNLSKALENYEKALKICQEIGHKKNELATLGNIGNVYRALEDDSKMIESFEQQLAIAIEIGDKTSEAAAYGNLGNAFNIQGNHEKAIEYHEKALSIFKENGDTYGIGVCCGSLGIAYESLEKYELAIEYLEKSLEIALQLGNAENEELAYSNLSSVFFNLEKYEKAIEFSQKYLKIAKETDSKDGQGQAHYNIGSAYFALAMQEKKDSSSYLKQAEHNLNKSLKYFELMFDDFEENDQHKIDIAHTCIGAYRRLTSVNVASKQTDEALLVSERSKARALNDLLAMKYSLAKPASSSETSPLQVTDVKKILTTLDAGVLFYAMHDDDPSTHMWALQSQSPFHYHKSELKGPQQPMESSSSLDGNSESDSDQTFSFLIEKSYETMKVREGMTCEDRSLEISEDDEVDVSLDVEMKKNDGHASSRCVWDEDDDEKPLELLYEVLIAPLQDKLQNQKEVIIIPDGDLFMVPFPALRDPKTEKCLSEIWQLRLAPSLTTLKVLQETPDEQHYRTGALIVGNPRVENVKFNGYDKSFINLPGAESEAKEIADLLGVQPLIGESATKQAVIERLQTGVSVIHFAAHGGNDGQIVLAPPASSTNAIPEEDDYILTVQEVQQSGVRAQLVVLSCCKSGRGEIKSEGVVGMSRAFLAAGARAVVASLWAIDDKATKEFMMKFYAHLKKKESASLSLQLAMKEMRETEKYKDPKYWAAFFLIGDDVTINLEYCSEKSEKRRKTSY